MEEERIDKNLIEFMMLGLHGYGQLMVEVDQKGYEQTGEIKTLELVRYVDFGNKERKNLVVTEVKFSIEGSFLWKFEFERKKPGFGTKDKERFKDLFDIR